ncbi:MAG: hypothetical protein ACHP7P_00910 [Terriglobales bacterium]
MRRSTATALLLLMLAVFLAPAAVATVTTPTPACCRTAGRHHCSGMVPSGPEGGAQFQGDSCPYRKPVALSGSATTPRATQTVALAGAHSFLGEFYSEVFISHREPPHSQRGPPPASAAK